MFRILNQKRWRTNILDIIKMFSYTFIKDNKKENLFLKSFSDIESCWDFRLRFLLIQ